MICNDGSQGPCGRVADMSLLLGFAAFLQSLNFFSLEFLWRAI